MESTCLPDGISGLPPSPELCQDNVPQRSLPFPPDALSSRQQRLLQNRKSRFSGSRLSITRLSSNFAKVAGEREQLKPRLNQVNRQENSPPDIALDTGSSSFQTNAPQISNKDFITQDEIIPLTADTFELRNTVHAKDNRNHILSSPIIYQNVSSAPDSTASSNPSLGDGNTMQLRELSGNEYRGPFSRYVATNVTRSSTRKVNATLHRSSFDTENYIEHIEHELQQAKQEMHSPTANKSLQNQLRVARLENERLKREMSHLRSAFESEVKNMVEHKTALEVDLRRKVKDLENDLEHKTLTIKELEYNHEEKRLDNSTLESLKAAIEKLEKEKTSMNDENRRMNKRNEVLSELLAMSPNKSHPAFELKSPVREKRPGRPMSMIIPRVPSSPASDALNSNPASVVTSPSFSVRTLPPLSTELEPFMLASSIEANSRQASSVIDFQETKSLTSPRSEAYSKLQNQASERQLCTSPSPYSIPLPSSPQDDAASQSQMRRKPRKFMSGSTQLKPLLLPALTGDMSNPTSASVVSSPGGATSRQVNFEPDSYFPPRHQESNPQDQMSSILRPSHGSPSYIHEVRAQLIHDTDDSLDDALKNGKGRSLNWPTSLASVLNRNGEGFESIETPNRSGMKRRSDQNGQEAIETSEWSGSDKPPSGGLRRSFTFPTNFNIDALGELELPEAHYDAFPSHTTNPDQLLWRAVPEPLFSPVARNSRHSLHLSPTKIDFRSADSSFVDTEDPPLMSSPYHPALLDRRSAILNEHSLVQATNSFISISRSRTPLDFLQQKHFGARPLASVTIRTVFNTISRCTSIVRNFKQDPLGLARKLIYKAWIVNWTRLGRLSWWVLGLFIAPKNQPEQTPWNWDDYDGEKIADKCCGTEFCNEDVHQSLKNCDECGYYRNSNDQERNAVELGDAEQPIRQDHRSGWGRSLWLWGKFSVAILLAVGGAVVRGPGEMLEEIDGKSTARLGMRKEKRYSRELHDLKSIRRFSDGHASSQELFVRTQKARKRQNQCASLASRTRFGDMLTQSSADAYFSSHFENSQRTAAYGPAHHRYEPIGDSTLRPFRGQRIHVEDVFAPGHAKDNGDIWYDNELSSRHSSTSSFNGSISSGILKWPPSPDFVYPEDSISQQS